MSRIVPVSPEMWEQLGEEREALKKVDSAAFFLLTNSRPVMVGDKVAFYQVQPQAVHNLEDALEAALEARDKVRNP